MADKLIPYCFQAHVTGLVTVDIVTRIYEFDNSPSCLLSAVLCFLPFPACCIMGTLSSITIRSGWCASMRWAGKIALLRTVERPPHTAA